MTVSEKYVETIVDKITVGENNPVGEINMSAK